MLMVLASPTAPLVNTSGPLRLQLGRRSTVLTFVPVHIPALFSFRSSLVRITSVKLGQTDLTMAFFIPMILSGMGGDVGQGVLAASSTTLPGSVDSCPELRRTTLKSGFALTQRSSMRTYHSSGWSFMYSDMCLRCTNDFDSTDAPYQVCTIVFLFLAMKYSPCIVTGICTCAYHMMCGVIVVHIT